MNKNVAILLILLLVIIGALGVYANNQIKQENMKQEQLLMKQKQDAEMKQKEAIKQQEEAQMKAQMDENAKEHKVILSALKNSTESGVAKFEEINGKVKVSLTLTGAPANVPQPAHIHAGACPGIGKVLYPLTTVTDGTSVTMLNVSMAELAKQLPLAINVHKSMQEVSTYVACGDINTDILKTSSMQSLSGTPAASSSPSITKTVTPMLTPTPSQKMGY